MEKVRSFKENMKKYIPLYLMSFSSVVFNIGTIILAIVILGYYAVIYFILVLSTNFIVQYYVKTFRLSMFESTVKLEFKQKEGKKYSGYFISVTNF